MQQMVKRFFMGILACSVLLAWNPSAQSQIVLKRATKKKFVRFKKVKKKRPALQVNAKGKRVYIRTRLSKRHFRKFSRKGWKLILRGWVHNGRYWKRFRSGKLRRRTWKGSYTIGRLCGASKNPVVVQTAMGWYHSKKKKWWNRRRRKGQKRFTPVYFRTNRLQCRFMARMKKKKARRIGLARPGSPRVGSPRGDVSGGVQPPKPGLRLNQPSKPVGFKGGLRPGNMHTVGRMTNSWRGTSKFILRHGNAWRPKGRMTNSWRKGKKGRMTNSWKKGKKGRMTNSWRTAPK